MALVGSYGVDAFGAAMWRAMAHHPRRDQRWRLSSSLSSVDSRPPPWFSVAPMMEWTDNHFRALARILSRCSWLYTEMVVAETIVHHENDLERWLEFPAAQHPIVLQLGGSNLANLSKAAKLVSAFGYDEINFNCGCPSSKVAGHGCFGARLMLSPRLVGEAMQAIGEESSAPVTVKCRIGVDDSDSYDQLCNFVSTVSSLSPTQHFIIHARKALLEGLSPAQNRVAPPLKYEYVLALMRDFPDLQFTLNGGITTVEQVNYLISDKGVNGVMLGRAAYNTPWCTLARADSCIYGMPERRITRRQVLREYEEYAESVIGKYGNNKPGIRVLVKPVANLFHGEKGSSRWRQAIDEHVRHAKSFSELLEKTMAVLPDSVLDTPVPYEVSAEESTLLIGSLPPSPSSTSKVLVSTA
ncbi:uncharacterized protein LOC9656735 isoform X1 [Selaginella moellendorffii]|uniref:uncharacterized protein LOC9656735 isoform X1 n=1 Tax=Selaginella moellendorffii TaxID=88036 RepID=UPI000D1C9F44|nr:uncharacterized protein LOC9656735 isoform X1 [Selaginella moellendorffii]|eukprot:XP_024516790.1 uncharacterized protein LOC9656735 isoform X1 [Selaginella moellendorffii]